MSRLKYGYVKVPKSVMPIKLENRVRLCEQLIVGGTYYVSYGSNVARKCELLKIVSLDGNCCELSVRLVDGHQITVYGYEIGMTPEEAVMNTIL